LLIEFYDGVCPRNGSKEITGHFIDASSGCAALLNLGEAILGRKTGFIAESAAALNPICTARRAQFIRNMRENIAVNRSFFMPNLSWFGLLKHQAN
jgi:hypothetical protein